LTAEPQVCPSDPVLNEQVSVFTLLLLFQGIVEFQMIRSFRSSACSLGRWENSIQRG
jgi:hypothetical protein